MFIENGGVFCKSRRGGNDSAGTDSAADKRLGFLKRRRDGTKNRVGEKRRMNKKEIE